MAKIIRREWTSRGPTGNKVRHVSFGYTMMVNGKRERCVSSTWRTEGEALEALSQRLKAVQSGQITPRPDVTLGTLTAEYLTYKAAGGKRSLKDDKRILNNRLLPHFGPGLPVRRLTEAILAYIEAHNENPRPIVWAKTAQEIIDKVGRAKIALIKAQQAASHH